MIKFEAVIFNKDSFVKENEPNFNKNSAN